MTLCLEHLGSSGGTLSFSYSTMTAKGVPGDHTVVDRGQDPISHLVFLFSSQVNFGELEPDVSSHFLPLTEG